MIDRALTFLADVVDAACNAFLTPGEILLSVLDKLAPTAVEVMTSGTGSTIVTFMLALVGWTILVIVGLLALRYCRHVFRQINAIVLTLLHRLKSFTGMLKTQLIWKYREFFPYKAAANNEVEHSDFDDVDLAVLRSVSERGPGFTSSAPELAEKLSLRPTQIQDRLEKLQRNNMLQFVLGSTDGFQNYTLTNSGTAFIAMWQR